MNAAMLQSLTDLQRKIDCGQGTLNLEGLLVDHLTQKNPMGIQDLLLIRERERGAIAIALEMNLKRINLLHLTVR